MERETIEVQIGTIASEGSTKPRHTIKIKSYLSGGESYALKELFQKEMTIDTSKKDEEGKPEIKTPVLTLDFMQKHEKKLIELLAFSFDGSVENVAQKIFDLRNSDYQIVLEAARRVEDENLTQAK